MRASLRGWLRQLGLFVVLLGVALAWSPNERAAAQQPAMRWDGLFELITGRYDYPPPWPGALHAANAPSRISRHSISADGRYVIFQSEATNFQYSMPGLYRRDRRTGQTELLLGNPANNAALSADGNHIVHEICDPWMRPDNQPICDVWAIDLRNWMWTPLSTTVDGTFGDEASGDPVVSADGRFVVFVTKAANLSGGPAGVKQVVLRDRDFDGNGVFDEPGTAVLETISMNPFSQAGDADSDVAEVSDDGRFVAFRSRASNLIPGDRNETWDVFLHDRQMHRVRRLNIRPEGQESSFDVEPHLSMSADGRYVAFASADGMLAGSSIDDTNGVLDVFVYDEMERTLTRIDVGWGPPIAMGYVPGNGPTNWPTLSADGRYISLQSAATNVEVPPVVGTMQVYVVDRFEQRATRVSVKANGEDLDQGAVRPAISGDGSVVLFWSAASNLIDVFEPGVEQLYAAVHLEVSPAEALVPGRGGEATFTVTTQQHTAWWAEWDWSQYWFGPGSGAQYGTGSGTFIFQAVEANPNPVQRSGNIRVGQANVTFTQDVGVSLTSVSPASGPMSGGTTVTLRGTGFEPGMIAYFSQMVPTEFVDSTTLVVVTPPSDYRGSVPVSVGTPYGQWAWLDEAFTYTDGTPPQVYGYPSGTATPDGWFTSDVTVMWSWWDPESPVTSTTCTEILVTTDTAGTTFTCSATSEGGTGQGSVTVKRDTRAPSIAVTSPAPQQLFALGSAVASAFTCSDATSGVANCGLGMPPGAAIDTSTPGWKRFEPGAVDVAGNIGTTSVEYAVSTNACAYPMPDLKGWWRFEGNTEQWMVNAGSIATRVGLPSDVFVDGVVGQAYQFEGPDGYLATGFAPTWWYDEKFAIAAWVKPSANTQGTILRRREAYAVARLANGSVAWAFRKFGVPGLTYYDTGVKVPLNVWSHVVVVLDKTTVKTYLNGRLADTATVGDLYNLAPPSGITLGGADDRPDFFKGALDEVMVFDHGLDVAGIEQLYLAGELGACVHKRTAFQISEPIVAYYGDETYAIDVRMVDEDGVPVVGRTIRIESQVNAWPHATYTKELVTDGDGRVHWDAPLSGAVLGYYELYLYVTFSGDTEYTRVFTTPDVIVKKRTPVITWPAPEPISYGTSLSNLQLNAWTDVPGTFSYSPASGTALNAGTYTLSATFTPSDTTRYNTATASVPLTVYQAMPTIDLQPGYTSVYDGQPHTVSATATGINGTPLGTLPITYNGSDQPPVNVGIYTAVARYEGSANYAPAVAGTTITIVKATPVVSVTAGTFVYDGQPHGATATVTGVDGGSLGAPIITYNGSPNVPVNAGAYEVVASYAGSANYAAASGTATLTIAKATPALSWPAPAPIVYGQPLNGIQLNATANMPGTFTYSPAAGAILNAGAGQVLTATFTPADQTNYAVTTVTTTLDVAKFTPEIHVFTGVRTYNGSPHAAGYLIYGINEYLDASEVTYNGSSEASPINAGTYEVVVRYDGSANYNAASATALLIINKADPIVTWSLPAAIVYGTALGAAQLNATANVAGTFAYTPAAGSIVNAGTQTLSAVFTPADAANYNGATAAVTIGINKAWPTVTVQFQRFTFDGQPHQTIATVTGVGGEPLAPPTVTYNGSPDLPVNAGSYRVFATYQGSTNYEMISAEGVLLITKAVPVVSVTGGTFTYDAQPHAAVGTVTGVGGALLGPLTFTYNGSESAPVSAGSYNVVGSFAGDGNYEPASATGTLVIDKAAPALSWNQPSAIIYGTALGAAQLNASASVAGSFSYAPAAGTLLNAGAGQTLTATFTPADIVNYTAGSVSTTIDVTRATPSVGVTGGEYVYDGNPHAAVGTVTGVGGESLGPLTFTYNGDGNAPVNAGSYAVVGSFAGDSNYEAASATATLTIAKASVVLQWSAPAPIVYGTALGAAQLNASANVAGTFSYSPAAGTVLDAGPEHTLTATFSPADAVNYELATVTTTIAVQKAIPSVSFADATFTYDGQPHAATASVTGVGGIALGPLTFTYNGSSAVPVNAGTYAAVVTFDGNDNYAPASGTATLTIGKAAPVLSWSTPAAIVYGTALGAAQLNATANVAGSFAYSPSAGTVLGAGAGQPLSATFTPADTVNYVGGTVQTTIGVTLAPLTVRANDAVKQFGAPLPPFSASFAGLVNGDSPASLAGALSLATSATQTSPVGTYAIVPAGLSSPNYQIAFVNGALTIVKGAVAVAVSTSPEPSGYEMPMTFTATVAAAAPAAGNLEGTVRFFDGATLLGTATISGGSATLATAGLDSGVRAIEARYDGDGAFETGTGSSSHVVNTAASTPVLSISSSRNPSSVGQSVSLTANVTMTSGAVSGTVVFYDGATLIGSAAIVSGRATVSTAALAAGSHAITARFVGNAQAPASVSPVFVQAVGASGWKNRSTTIGLASSANPSLLGDAVVLTATVVGSSTSAPSGRVLFTVDGEVVGDPEGLPVTLVSGLTVRATVSVPGLAHGRHKVTATYLGDPTYKGSSAALAQSVN